MPHDDLSCSGKVPGGKGTKRNYRSLGHATSSISSKKAAQKKPFREVLLPDGTQVFATEAVFWYDKRSEVTHVLLVTGNNSRVPIASVEDRVRKPGCKCIERFLRKVNQAINNAQDAPVRLKDIPAPGPIITS